AIIQSDTNDLGRARHRRQQLLNGFDILVAGMRALPAPHGIECVGASPNHVEQALESRVFQADDLPIRHHTRLDVLASVTASIKRNELQSQSPRIECNPSHFRVDLELCGGSYLFCFSFRGRSSPGPRRRSLGPSAKTASIATNATASATSRWFAKTSASISPTAISSSASRSRDGASRLCSPPM